jgi:hypothetical protein
MSTYFPLPDFSPKKTFFRLKEAIICLQEVELVERVTDRSGNARIHTKNAFVVVEETVDKVWAAIEAAARATT